MKEGIHPTYITMIWEEGKEYPYITLDISSESHPFYTGEQRVVSSEGRVANFNRRFGALKGKV